MPIVSPTFIWVIFPLVDLRPVLKPTRRLVVRPWQDRSIENYLRGFGRVCYRKNDVGGGVLLSWLRANEAWYFSGRHFARILPKEPRRVRAKLPGGWEVRQPIPARLFADAVLSARLEIVLEATPPGEELPDASLLREVAGLAVEVRRRQPGRRAPAREVAEMHDLKRHFRTSYARARLIKPELAARDQPEMLELLRPIDPLIVVLTRPRDAPELVKGRWLDTVQAPSASFRVLLLVAHEGEQATARALRRTFVRLYCLTEAMRQLRQRLSGPAALELTDDAPDQLEPLVQQAQDGTLALRDRPGGSLGALETSVEQFRIEAEELAKLLVRPEQQPLVKRLTSFSEEWSRGAIMLPEELIEDVYTLGIGLELYDQRDVLLAPFPDEIRAALERKSRPNEQLYLDILSLSRLAGPDGRPLLARWLRTAALLHVAREAEASLLTRYAEVAARTGVGTEAP
jgi:hypothetical protein